MTLTRRRLFGSLLALSTWPSARLLGQGRTTPSPLSVEGYIYIQQQARLKQTLAEGIDTFFDTVRDAGFQRIELSDPFMTPDLRSRVLDGLATRGLSMPSIYVGGAMHEERLADDTIARSIDIAKACRAVGCRAIVGNPSPKAASAEKTDDELAVQARMLDRMGAALGEIGVEYWVHNHTPEMRSQAREWWHTLRNTDPRRVRVALDIDWVHQGDQDPLALLRAAGSRVASLHLRSSIRKRWQETFGDGDVDYRPVASELKAMRINPLLVVELAYHPETVISRPLLDNLRMGREYAERVFALR